MTKSLSIGDLSSLGSRWALDLRPDRLRWPRPWDGDVDRGGDAHRGWADQPPTVVPLSAAFRLKFAAHSSTNGLVSDAVGFTPLPPSEPSSCPARLSSPPKQGLTCPHHIFAAQKSHDCILAAPRDPWWVPCHPSPSTGAAQTYRSGGRALVGPRPVWATSLPAVRKRNTAAGVREYGPGLCVPPATMKPGRNWGEQIQGGAVLAPHGSAYSGERGPCRRPRSSLTSVGTGRGDALICEAIAI